jgi:hypothetical protein
MKNAINIKKQTSRPRKGHHRYTSSFGIARKIAKHYRLLIRIKRETRPVKDILCAVLRSRNAQIHTNEQKKQQSIRTP